jgi:Transglycosylase
MRLSARQRNVIVSVAIAGVAGAILFLPAIYFLGLWLSPPRPVPSTSEVPAVFADAVWAHINGGRASTMRPMNPINLGHFVGCLAVADLTGDGQVRNVETGACAEVMPAIQAAEYFSRLHLRDEGVLPGKIRYAFAQVATGAWITRNWSKAELIESLSARADFGLGWRGAESAARGYFGQPLSELVLPQAAMLASFVGTVGGRGLGMASSWVDPWCDPERVARMRRRVLDKMRKNLAIDDAAFELADRSELGLADPPADHKPCSG